MCEACEQIIKDNYTRKFHRGLITDKKIRAIVMERYNYRCAKCGSPDNLTIDHIKPRSKGIDNRIEKLQVLCRSCNSKKGTKTIKYKRKISAPTPKHNNKIH